MPAGPQRQGGALPRACPSVRMAVEPRPYARGGSSVKRIFMAASAALCLAVAAQSMPRENTPDPLSQSAAVSPSASTAPGAPVPPTQPVDPSTAAPAEPLAPGLPQALSPAAADADQPEEVGQDQSATAQTVAADLAKLDSPTLARLARSLGVDAPTVWFDPDQQQPLTSASDNAQSVDATALYAALQQRSDAGDKDARQALALARLRGDPRAQPAPASDTAAASAMSPAAAALGQALSAAAQALGLSPSAAATPAP